MYILPTFACEFACQLKKVFLRQNLVISTNILAPTKRICIIFDFVAYIFVGKCHSPPQRLRADGRESGGRGLGNRKFGRAEK